MTTDTFHQSKPWDQIMYDSFDKDSETLIEDKVQQCICVYINLF